MAWLIGPRRPKAAATAVNASRTGTNAATIAPKANRSTSRETGTDSTPARERSSLFAWSLASLVDRKSVV